LSIRPEGAQGGDETRDAARRTRLANERTYLAWWRTGLTAIAVCIGLGRIVPGVSDVTQWPYQVVGAGYGLLGLAFMLVAHVRVRMVERAVDRGEFARMDERLSLALLVAGFLLGAAAIGLVLFAV
jgi:putative membrane protein